VTPRADRRSTTTSLDAPPGHSPRSARQQDALASDAIATTRTTFTLEESLAEQARLLGVNISGAARDGVAAAVRAACIERDRAAYRNQPEEIDDFWADAEAWTAE
jgi:post-segregation antitoxin (ccd killing protein)